MTALLASGTLNAVPVLLRDRADPGGAVSLRAPQRLVQVEAPLALPVILTGIKLSAVISIATATIGSTVAASTLGEVIIAGLLSNNLAFVLQGGLVVAVIAILSHDALSALERRAAGLTARRLILVRVSSPARRSWPPWLRRTTRCRGSRSHIPAGFPGG